MLGEKGQTAKKKKKEAGSLAVGRFFLSMYRDNCFVRIDRKDEARLVGLVSPSLHPSSWISCLHDARPQAHRPFNRQDNILVARATPRIHFETVGNYEVLTRPKNDILYGVAGRSFHYNLKQSNKTFVRCAL